MHLSFLRIIISLSLCLQFACLVSSGASSSPCHCILIKDCAPFVHLLLHHQPETRNAVFSTVHAAGCGFHGLEPLVCCPQNLALSLHMPRAAPPKERWSWGSAQPRSGQVKQRSSHSFKRFVAKEMEMHLLDYIDFNAQRNCPQPLVDDDDEHHFDGYHYSFDIEHALASETSRPEPEDKPFVFPGDLRFQSNISTKSEGELMAAASQEQATTNASTAKPTATLTKPTNPPDCGVSLNTRITGGEPAQPGQYPWLARIAYRNRTNRRITYRCSGSLISNNYIVTAAHCVVNLVNDLELFQVRIGDDAPSSRDCVVSAANCTNPNLFDVARVLVHPNYDQPKYANDIALLNFKNSGNTFTPICLPLNTTAMLAVRLIGQIGIAAGWSTTTAENQTTNARDMSTSVRFLRLPIVNTTTCAISYASFSENFQQPIVITPNHLCAQGQPMNDVCRGDSGGPFMDDGTSGLLNADGRHTLLGIVAFGPTLCGVTTIPGVYTAVSSYIDWIFGSIA